MKSSLIHLVVASIVCVAALAVFGVSYATLKAKSIAVTTLQNKIDAKTESISRATATRAALEEITGDEAAVQGYFVPETGVVAFIDDLQSRGRQLGARVDVLSVSVAGGTVHPALMLTLTATGTFDAVMRTVGAIEYAPYDISILTLSSGEINKGAWHADLTLSVGSRAAVAATSTP